MKRVVLIISICVFCTFTVASVTAQEKVLKHIVSFKFKDEVDSQQVSSIIEAFEELQSQIPEIQAFEWGINNSPEGLNKGMTHCFVLTFKNEVDRDIYLPHPAHKAFIDEHGPKVADVFVIDYYVEN